MSSPNEIAVIGIGCRFPGGVSNRSAFWDLLSAGTDAIGPVPESRWDPRKFNSDENESCRSGKTWVKEGGFLSEDIFAFDAKFFGISPKEADALDPQQRLLLEVSYETLEDAGLPMENLSGAPVGVFVGAFTMDNLVFRSRTENRDCIESHDAMGFSMTLLANRLSFFYDWTGPSMAVDTACSSSLVAVHYACESLLRGDSDLAIAGGVNVILVPDSSTVMSRGGFLSPDCRCRAFDAAANGYARGEGAGLVLLKTLERALADGDRIHAVIRGTGINQDGRTAGLALPNPERQKDLFREVHARSGVDSRSITFVEAHGTGTQAGDRAEIEAINAVFQPLPERPLFVSSVKTNFGHLEAAAGIAGLIKAILCLRMGQLPPHLHLENPNPDLHLAERGIVCPKVLTDLERSEEPIIAGVSSFGYGGTNAHVVVESRTVEPVGRIREETPGAGSGAIALTSLSAGSDDALRAMCRDHADWLKKHPGRLDDWSFTLRNHRSRHRLSLCVPFDHPEAARTALTEFAETGHTSSGCLAGIASESPEPVAFVFSGMGPQWRGMGRNLYRDCQPYATAVDRCDDIFGNIAGWSIRDVMQADDPATGELAPEVAQIANLCLQIGLAELWEAWGIEPAAVVGHSTGEMAAACVSGALSRKQSLLVGYHRSRLQQALAGTGGMLAVGQSESQVRCRIAGNTAISLAAVNSPASVTLTGNFEQLSALARELEAEQVFNRILGVSVPYHSNAMDGMESSLRSSLDGLMPSAARIPFYSTVTGGRLEGERLGAGYWWRNVRCTVRFFAAIKRLLEAGFRTFLEIGPHPVLSRSLHEIAASRGVEIRVLSSLRRNLDDMSQLRCVRSRLFLLGHPLPPVRSGQRAELPSYPWQRKVFWRESASSSEDFRGRPEGHVFLQRTLPGPQRSWETELNRHYFPFLDDHKIHGEIIWPGAALVEAGLALNHELNDGKPVTLSGLRFPRLLRWSSEKQGRLATVFDGASRKWKVEFGGFGDSADWQVHATGTLETEMLAAEPSGTGDFHQFAEKCPERLDPKSIFRRLQRMGLTYGESFRRIRKICRGDGCFVIEIASPEPRPRDHYQIHPAVLDSAFQAFAASVPEAPGHSDMPWVPTGIRRFHFHRPAGSWVRVAIDLREITDSRILGDIILWDPDGGVVAEADGIEIRRLGSGAERGPRRIYHSEWEEASPADSNRSGHRFLENTWLVLCADSPAEPLADLLVQRLPSEPTILRWGSDPGGSGFAAELQVFRRDAGSESPTQIVFLPSCASGPGREGDLEALIDLVRCRSLFSTGSAAPVLSVVTTGLFGIDGRSGPLSLSAAPVWGLGAVVANEYPEISIRLIDLPRNPEADSMVGLLNELGSEVDGNEIALNGPDRKLRTWVRSEDDRAPPVLETVEVPSEGNYRATLRHDRCQGRAGLYHLLVPRPDPQGDGVEVRVDTAGLNFKDLLKVSGRIAPSATEGTFSGEALGLECAGRVDRVGPDVRRVKIGDRVIAFGTGGCFASHILTAESSVIKMPDFVAMEDGSSLIPWCTAWYGLIDQGRLREGESVLIHSAAGGVGLAAVQVAHAAGGVVFATASTPEKRAYLTGLGIAHVMDSSSLRFAEEILDRTGGRGVDVVLNSLSGEALRLSFECLAPGGRFIEIGKKDIIENSGLPMESFNRNASFIAIDLDRMFVDNPEAIRASIESCLDWFRDGRIRSLPREVLPASQVREAFRKLASRERIGRIALKYEGAKVEVPAEESHPAIDEDGCYLITGGTSGLGLEIARWLVGEGARKLVILSRRGPVTPEARSAVIEFGRKGCGVLAPEVDLSDRAALEELFACLDERKWRIRGVFHCAMVLDDDLLRDVTPEGISRVFAPKVHGAWNLELLLAEASDLDIWVSFSSVSNLLGNTGQGIYVAANTFLEQLAEQRRIEGKPAVTILLGMLEDTGVVQRSDAIAHHLERAGLRGIRSEEVAEELLELSIGPNAVVGLFDLDWERWGDMQLPVSSWHRFARLLTAESNRARAGRVRLIREALLTVDPAERVREIHGRIARILSEILLTSPEEIDRDLAISQLGIDSLTVVELLIRIRNEVGVDIGENEIIGDPRIDDLCRMIVEKILLGEAAGPIDPDSPPEGIAPAADAIEMSGESRPDDSQAGHEPRRSAIEEGEADLAVSPRVTGGSDTARLVGEVDSTVFNLIGMIARERAGDLSGKTGLFTDLNLDMFELLGLRRLLENAFSVPFPDRFLEGISSIDDVIGRVRARLLEGSRSGEGESAPPNPSNGSNGGEAGFRAEAMPDFQRLTQLAELLVSAEISSPYFSVHEGVAGNTTRIGGRRLINFSSYNYLGMSGDPKISQAAIEAIRRWGTSVSASRLVSGNRSIHCELEQSLANFTGTEAAVVFVGGHATNESVIGHLFGPGDLIVHDSLSHNSIVQGAILSGAERRPFHHCDYESLDRLLAGQRRRYRRALIVVEGVYSMDGDFSDLPALISIKRRHDCYLMVDEAHSIGTMGGTGRGMAEHFEIDPAEVDIWMGTLSKSLGSCGGYIAGSRELVDYLRYTAPGFVYSVGMPPAAAAAALAALTQLQEKPERVARLKSRSRLFLDAARSHCLDTGLSEGTPIVPVMTGNSLQAIRLSRSLFESGINVQPILSPAVKESAARLRFFLSWEHTEEQIHRTVEELARQAASLSGRASDQSAPAGNSAGSRF